MVIVDGRVVSGTRIALDVSDSAFAGRVGLFETVAVVGGRALRLLEHHARLEASCAALGLGPAPARESFERDLARLLEGKPPPLLAWRLVVWREEGRLRRCSWASPPPPRRPFARLGLAAPAFRSRGALARHKSLDWMGSRLALEEGKRRGLDEVLFAQPDGRVLEGTRTSLFMVSQGALRTPDTAQEVLPGVTRAAVLAAAREVGLEAREAPLSAEDLRAADEVFVCSSLAGIWPVESFEAVRWGAPGPLTARLRGVLDAPPT